MAREQAGTGYRNLYARLVRLYPTSFREQYGEGLEQTFNDVLRERAEKAGGLFGCALWMFAETSVGIIKGNWTSMITQYRNIVRIALVTGLLLMIPLVAMQFSEEVNWGLGDFIVMGGLLFGSGLTYELLARKGGTTAYKAAVGVAVGASLLLIWINLAVGIIGSEDNPANVLYLGVIYIALIGATIVRLRPRGMSRVLFFTALTQALVPVIALLIWRPTFDDPPGMVSVFFLNAGFVTLYLVSALLFRHAGETDPR